MNSSFRNLSIFLLMAACTSVLSAASWTLPPRFPIAGEWNSANPGDEIGFYNTETSTFFLCSQRASISQLPCTEFTTPITKAGRIPLMGHWSHIAASARPALYDPATGQLLIYRYLSCLPDQCGSVGHLVLAQIYSLGVVGAKATSGDWNGDGIDTLALLVPNPKRQHCGGPPVADVLFYAADHQSIDRVLQLDFNPLPYQLTVGRWPGNSPSRDFLGFYDSTNRLALLETETADFRLLPIATPHTGLQMFGAAWGGSQGDSIGLYTPYRPGCEAGPCHRVDFFTVPPTDSLGGTNSIVPGEDPHPHLDAVFPDDPVDP